MSNTYKNPNKENRIRKSESDTHEQRRNIKRLLEEIDDFEFDEEEYEDIYYEKNKRIK